MLRIAGTFLADCALPADLLDQRQEGETRRDRAARGGDHASDDEDRDLSA